MTTTTGRPETTGTTAPRADLLSLTPETLAALSNRGLVKRATKDLDAGTGPEVTTADDGTVLAHFADGTRTGLPPGAGLDAAVCGCGAAGVCRHVIGLVLGYQRAAEQAPLDTAPSTPTTSTGVAKPEGEPTVAEPNADPTTRHPWSPSALDDDALTAAVGSRAVSAARRTFDRGYTARVHRATPGEPIPWVELPTCTVRFPVPGEMAYALTDAATELRGEVVALAVWAFRAADEQAAPDEPSAQVAVGGPCTGRGRGTGRDRDRGTAATRAALDAVVALADTILWEGAAHADPVLAASIRRTSADLSAASLHWPAGAATDLADQLTAHTNRTAQYDPARLATLIAELHARHRASASPEAVGTHEPGETPLRRVRLTALGCRIADTADHPVAEVYFAHPDTGLVLVLRKHWKQRADQPQPTAALAGRRVLGTTLTSLASGNVITENAKRTASRTLTLSRGRLGTTTVTPVGTSWLDLPSPLLIRDLAAHTANWSDRPPRLIRPRVEAESVHAIEVSAIKTLGYDPAAQRLEATFLDAAGNEAVLTAPHNPLAPTSLDALAETLASQEIHCVTGMIHRTAGRTVITPLSLLTATGETVTPDLAPHAGATRIPPLPPRTPDPLTTALTTVLAALATTAHQGLRHTTPPTLTRLQEAAAQLARVGLTLCAEDLRGLVTALSDDNAAYATRAWLNAHLRVLVTAELLDGH